MYSQARHVGRSQAQHQTRAHPTFDVESRKLPPPPEALKALSEKMEGCEGCTNLEVRGVVK